MILNDDERAQLQELPVKWKSQVRHVKRTQILLAAADDVAEDEITKAVHTSTSTIYRTKRCFVEDGLEAVARCTASRWPRDDVGQRRGPAHCHSLFIPT